jgi:hypothetical protein
MIKVILLMVSVLPLISCENKDSKLFTDPLQVESDVNYVESSLDQVKELLKKLDAPQFRDANELVADIQKNLKYAKLQFDANKDFDLLGQKVESLKDQLSQLGPKLRNGLETFWRKDN